MKRTRIAAALAAAAVLAAPAAAGAHVTLQPKEAPAGGFTRLDVRVPNERDDASTTKVELQLPAGFESASYEPVAGWKVDVDRSADRVEQITWTAAGDDAAIPAGAFRDFGLSVKVPGAEGDTLTFKALQTYDSGEVVRWIGAADSDNPAPTVAVGAPAEAHGADHAASTGASAATPPAAAASDSGSGDTLAVIALVVGVLGLAAGAAGLLAARRAAAPGPSATA